MSEVALVLGIAGAWYLLVDQVVAVRLVDRLTAAGRHARRYRLTARGRRLLWTAAALLAAVAFVAALLAADAIGNARRCHSVRGTPSASTYCP